MITYDLYEYPIPNSSCNTETGQHEACMAECCPVSVLQLIWLMLGQLQHAPFIHVGCLVTSTNCP